MSQDLVKALGVKVLTVDISDPVIPDYDWQDVVLVKDLRAALEKLPVVYGYQQKNGIILWGDGDISSVDTHSARLLAIEEIKKEPLVEKFVQLIPESNLANLMIRKNFAGKRVKVTVFRYRDWETDRKSTRLNSSHSAKSRMPSSA